MNDKKARRLAPAAMIAVLMIAAVVVSAVRGSAEGAVAAIVVGTLLLAYTVRHEMRARTIYHRDDSRSDDDASG